MLSTALCGEVGLHRFGFSLLWGWVRPDCKLCSRQPPSNEGHVSNSTLPLNPTFNFKAILGIRSK